MTQVFASTIERFTNAEPSRFDFARIADTYGRWYETPVGRVYDALEKRAVARALPRSAPGARLLDVGCGTGHWSAFFSEHGFVVTGVDTSPEMIEVAREKRIANASFEVADAHAFMRLAEEHQVVLTVKASNACPESVAPEQDQMRLSRAGKYAHGSDTYPVNPMRRK